MVRLCEVVDGFPETGEPKSVEFRESDVTGFRPAPSILTE